MASEIYVSGKRHRIDPSMSKGKGGEADIFDLGGGIAAKIWKQPSHADFTQPEERVAAAKRIDLYQHKIQQLPPLPSGVVTPLDLAKSKLGDVLGYTMPFKDQAEVLLSYGQPAFRATGAVSYDIVLDLLRVLHGTIAAAHKQIVFGDFNDLNVLIAKDGPYVIDIDSCQFGPYLTMVFTEKFVDPLLCNQDGMLVKPHNRESDWYAFAIMLMQSLVFVGPYGGVFRPKDPKKSVPHSRRPAHRITVFHPEVLYPKPAVPLDRMPDDLLQVLHKTFTEDLRGQFPTQLLHSIRWTKCSVCATEHGRGSCPVCKQAVPQAIRSVIEVRGTVTAERTFQTTGTILYASMQHGKLRWIYHDHESFYRDDNSGFLSGTPRTGLRYRIWNGDVTLIAFHNQFRLFAPQHGVVAGSPYNVDDYMGLPVLDANAKHFYWLDGGVLYRDDTLGPKRIGDVLRNQTLFWVGDSFGFGFYRAGSLSQAFVFDAETPGINDQVEMPPISGQLIDSTTFFSGSLCWFVASMRSGSKTINRCCVVNRAGKIVGLAEAEDGDGSWLGHIRGKCATGNMLLCATDEGLVRVELTKQGGIEQTKSFPDTEPFLDAGAHLFPGKEGLYVVTNHEVRVLKIA